MTASKEETREANETPEVSPAILFEILLSSNASEWPESCSGVRPVLAAVQKMLTAASGGSSRGFDEAEAELDEAIYRWHSSLFGEKP